MKRTLLGLSLLSSFLFAGLAFGEQAPRGAPDGSALTSVRRGNALRPGQLSEADVKARHLQTREEIRAELALTPEQLVQVETIDAAALAKGAAIMDDRSLSRDERAVRRMAIAKEANAARDAILTPEQRVKLRERFVRLHKAREAKSAAPQVAK